LTHVTVSTVLFKVDGVLKFSNISVKRLTIAVTGAPFFVIHLKISFSTCIVFATSLKITVFISIGSVGGLTT
jgi:hypothetical protein